MRLKAGMMAQLKEYQSDTASKQTKELAGVRSELANLRKAMDDMAELLNNSKGQKAE